MYKRDVCERVPSLTEIEEAILAYEQAKEARAQALKHEKGRLFIFMHGDESEQNEFLQQCVQNGCFGEPVKFAVRQRPFAMYPHARDNTPLDTKVYMNGERPYFTVSNTNPDLANYYCNWTYLESAIEGGWRSQFSI